MDNGVLMSSTSELEARFRKARGVTLEEICYGLVGTSQVSSWENGNASIDFAVSYRLLSRLFIEDSKGVWWVNSDEYEAWYKQNNIVWLLCMQKYDEALAAIDDYANEDNLKPLEEQFILRMRALYLMATDSDKDEIYRLTKEALEITVPGFTIDNLVKLTVSSQELDMILDIERYSTNNRRVYGAIIGYLIAREIKEPYQRRILPKATYYYVDAIDIEQIDNLNEIITLKGKIDYAIECLRNVGYLNYVLELFDKKKAVLTRQIVLDPDNRKEYEDELNTISEYIELFSDEYERFGVRKDTILIPDTYVPCSAYNMSEIVYKRRTMLGISQSMLAKDLCDIKTIRRWEQGKTVPQTYIRDEVFTRLKMARRGIPYEKTLVLPLTGGMLSYEASPVSTWNEYRYKGSYIYDLLGIDRDDEEYDYQEWIYEAHNMHIPTETIYDYVKRAIERKYPIDVILNAPELWFDRFDLVDYCNFCFYDKDVTERGKYLAALKEYLDRDMNTPLEMSDWVIRENIYNLLRNEYGNAGRWDESNEIADYLLRGQLCYRRFHLNAQLTYNNWWNENERRKNDADWPEGTEKTIRRCILIAELLKSRASVDFYKWKLDVIRKRNS